MHVGVLAFEVGQVHLSGMSNVMSVASAWVVVYQLWIIENTKVL